MDQKRTIILPLGIFLIIFLSVFLIMEINITGRSIGNIIIKNTAPVLLTAPIINNSAPDTGTTIRCIPGQYYDSDGHPNVRDYFRWYKNNLPIIGQILDTLDLSVSGNGNAPDVLRCSQTSSDGFSNSTWRNSSAVTVTQTLPPPPPPPGGGGSGTTTIICSPNYYCSTWSACLNDIQTRDCVDLNSCSGLNSRTDTRNCIAGQLPETTETTILEQKTSDIIESYSIISLVIITIALLLFIILLVVATILSRKHGKPKETIKQSQTRSDLLRYIKQALDRGYSPEQIEEALVKAGWPKEMIQSGFKELK